ncbi:hypothetical protein IT571_01260 [Candidatus Sumerlaeota bacterium]|nr:hypothetical protein [Candidatus Sumerlaeota bacterium]
MAAKNTFTRIENRIVVCREYTELWQNYFTFFSEDMEDRLITEQMEKEFQNIMNVLALNHYKFSELCGEFMKNDAVILDILAQSDSLQTIKDMPEATRSKLMIEWHTTFIDMNKALGKLLAKLTPKQLQAMQGAPSA